jgi:glycosyltransferase involved in cell wall biosynthesis
LKVGIFTGGFLPEAGGGFTFVNELVKALAATRSSRHEFVAITTNTEEQARGAFGHLPVLSLADAYAPPRLAARIGGGVQRRTARLLGQPRRLGEMRASDAAIDARLTANAIDVIWYPSAWQYCSLEIPYITVVWDLQHRRQPYFPEVSDDGKWEYRQRWMSTFLRRAALVIAGAEAGREEIERCYGVQPERMKLIPHPTPSFMADARSSTAPRVVEGDYIFYPAQFWPHKNHANLLHALRLLRDQGMNLSLVLTGSDKGNQAYVLQLAERLGLTSHVRMLGFVPNEQLVSLYRHAVALSYVTFFGPENLPPLEAFAAGCPVVASDVAGAREQMGDAAVLVDPRRPEEIAAAIKNVSSDQALRARLIERGFERAKRSTPASFVAEVIAWLDEFEPIRRCWPSGTYQADKGRWP